MEYINGPDSDDLIASKELVDSARFRHAQLRVSSLDDGRKLAALASVIHPWGLVPGYRVDYDSVGFLALYSSGAASPPTPSDLYDAIAETAIPIQVLFYRRIGLRPSTGEVRLKSKREYAAFESSEHYGWSARFTFPSSDDARRVRSAYSTSILGQSM